MQIREAIEQEIPEIIEVLKASLGETYSKKTEAVWRYKHEDNPFGKSVVLVAEENEEIVGIRAFMHWEWRLGDQIFSTFRAVDTATHPDHQGKGVFKKLTLNALEVVKEQGDDFIFNTPNTQSLPGYLKMGWKEVSKLKIRVKPANPFHWLNNKTGKAYTVNNTCGEGQLANLTSVYNKLKAEENRLFTLKSPEYLIWRYENNPLQNYEIKADQDFYLAAYIKEHKYVKELRITEHIYSDDRGLQKINKAVKEFSKKFGAQIITSTGLSYGVGFSGNYGPVLTLRDVNLDPNLKQELLQLNNWSYTLGDLELF
ncbi:GNAT family N-acetyltransferase [Salegentibacter salegens]|uniref:Acetyltransferase (GNAT) domain-containing protein n=1 Tax=Salegentibacter salegens TaxID=143223 RepID=A0A1M7HDN5_9FLAO|nr:GNAT family N-acetyltransferase [Salegentibacter salegens]PRX43491.1 acetyltransferase (GNAT) family protein [Salegentibacter salegens]SHM26595.1 Acetyltransferase (GNAT) domain-containing protein [Salegentibacter salegens]